LSGRFVRAPSAPAGEGCDIEARPLRVALLAGGTSAERDVSLASAHCIRAGLEAAGNEVLPITIAADGAWRAGEERLALHPGEGLLGADLAFPALHGPYGEDGTIQGVLEALRVPYVGADLPASALCIDKIRFKDLMRSYSIPQVRYIGVEGIWADALATEASSLARGGSRDFAGALQSLREQIADLGLPVFVKPARMGSSLGISRVEKTQELPGAIAAALLHDQRVIIEQAALGIEVECALLEDPGGGEPVVSQPGAVRPSGDWYDFAAKYSQGGMELSVPAPLPRAQLEAVRKLALGVFEKVGCAHLARVDFFLCGERILVNELNTMPGFTPTSVYPRLLEHEGLTYRELLERLCALALIRAKRRSAPAPTSPR
jgi:D-alanine-D-alanine ligase